MNIGKAIKIWRKQKGLSQKDLSNAAGLSFTALRLLETNITFPQKSTLESISKALDIPTSYLLFFAINEEDIPEEKRLAFKSLSHAIKSVLFSDTDDDDS